MPLKIREWIEFDETWTLEDAIRNLKHHYEKSKHNPKFKAD